MTLVPAWALGSELCPWQALRVIPLSDAPITHDIAFVRLPHSIFEDDLRALFEGLQTT